MRPSFRLVYSNQSFLKVFFPRSVLFRFFVILRDESFVGHLGMSTCQVDIVDLASRLLRPKQMVGEPQLIDPDRSAIASVALSIGPIAVDIVDRPRHDARSGGNRVLPETPKIPAYSHN